MKRIINFIRVYAGTILILASTGCSTRTFTVSCQPDDALVLQGSYIRNIPLEASIIGKPPLESKITFLGKKDQYYFTAMQRGFYMDTLVVLKDSDPNINIQLRQIPDADTTTFNPAILKNARFVLLPVKTDVVLHKGVGNLDKYERSEQQSMEVSNQLDRIMGNEYTDSNILYPGVETGGGYNEWIESSKKINDYLLTLNTNLLNYYPDPPFISATWLSEFHPFMPGTDSLTYIIYTYCKTIKPTAGRIIGNAAALVASGAVEGYNTAMYGYSATCYDASAFALDNSTLLVSFVICPATGKVLLRKDIVVNYDITGEKAQEAITERLMAFFKEELIQSGL